MLFLVFKIMSFMDEFGVAYVVSCIIFSYEYVVARDDNVFFLLIMVVLVRNIFCFGLCFEC